MLCLLVMGGSMHQLKPRFQLKNNVIFTPLLGAELLHCPLLNKDMAFTQAERDMFRLQGLLPAHEETIEEQVARCYAIFAGKSPGLEQHIYLRQMQDQNE